MDETAIRAEVDRHHAALVAWLADGDETSWSEFASAHVPEFSVVSVGGRVLAWHELSQDLGAAGGSQPGLTIAIDHFDVLATTTDVVVVRFRETHHQAGTRGGRWTTAVLQRSPGSPAAFVWLAVHETAENGTRPGGQ